MVSTFGWLDTDSEQRRRMLEVVDLFKEEGTVDELGIGSIRDALSDILFPGTSVLHTRLRYVLFIPWLMQLATRKPSPEEMGVDFRNMEYRLIPSLLSGGESTGVFGRFVRNNLKNLPSSAYWGSLAAWQIVTVDSAGSYFRRQHDYRQLQRRSVVADDPESRDRAPITGIDANLPARPDGLMSAVGFELTPDDEQYLSYQIASATTGSMLSWLIQDQPGNSPDFAWDVDNLSRAPVQLRSAVDHARRFSVSIHGAHALYNLLLAEKAGNEALTTSYRSEIALWREELLASEVLEGWDRGDWWATIHRQNPRLRPITNTFVDHWLELIAADDDVAASDEARRLINTRERQIKGGRARLVNQSALDRWSGRSGMGRLSYRWEVAQRHLQDLYAARAAS